jgi:hypothetical protein
MAYKVFTNGSPLPASDLNTYLMNQSVITFANSTARSATLTSPTEGMVTYLEDTNKVEVYTGAAWVDINDNSGAIPLSTVTTAGDLIVADGNASVTRLGIGANGSIPRVDSGALGYLPVGTNGQVLTVDSGAPTWVSPATGGTTNWTLLVNQANIPTGSTTASISFTGGYDKYAIYINGLSSSGGATYYLQIRDNTSTAVSFGPLFSLEWQGATAYFRAPNLSGASEPDIGYLNSGTRVFYGSIHLDGASKAGLGRARWSFGPDSNTASNWGQSASGHFTIPATRVIEAVRFRVDSGTIDNGTITVYGA